MTTTPSGVTNEKVLVTITPSGVTNREVLVTTTPSGVTNEEVLVTTTSLNKRIQESESRRDALYETLRERILANAIHQLYRIPN
ncbi:hypothetical protein H6G91_13420 [Nostoc muscorum FACHB-395]|uniref:hypothetical protein n=1 Tax=Nostoc sp. C057 TaxID=2576903 RepID=UPI0015C37CED|nr:hypothetical protein [Nostoc sp. C057]MBD2508266.1 hypothetical protein [Desmonostoc muscorum FACHB-395]QLE48588.1 hypothetical protein FD724_10990 [Nostoc sp. C057]